MALDTRLQEARELIGKQLRAYREGKGFSVDDLAKRTNIHRTTIYKMEDGEVNFTIDKLAALLHECGISLHDFLVGLKQDGYSEAKREAHRQLNVILDSDLPFHRDGILLNLKAIHELVERTLNPAPDRQAKANLHATEKKKPKRKAAG